LKVSIAVIVVAKGKFSIRQTKSLEINATTESSNDTVRRRIWEWR